MKKYFGILVILLLCLFGCSTTNNTKQQLESVELQYSEFILQWETVENAEYYEIFVNNVSFVKIYETQYDLSSLRNGSYTIGVIAFDEDNEYKKSELVLIEVVIEKEEPTPDIPPVHQHSFVNGECSCGAKDPNYVKPPVNDDGMGEREIEFFMINDTHGAFSDGDYAGMTRISSYFNVNDPEDQFIKVANGDIFQGSYVSNIFYGLPLVDALNTLDFDCFVVGNHEFDWGIEEIAKYKDGNMSNGEAEFPFLGANIIDKRTNQIPEWMDPYTIIEKNGLKIGIIGVMGETHESSILQTYIENYEFTNVLPVVKNYSKLLRTSEGCDLVVVSIHDYDETLNANMAKLSGDERIDLILCGHTHTNNFQEFTRNDGKKIIAVQNQDKNRSASHVSIQVLDKQYVSSKFTRIYPSNYSIDSNFDKLLNTYDQYINMGERVLGKTNSNISKSTLGYYSTSAMTDYFDVDYSIINTAGVRATIGKGDITVSDVFNCFPFNNEVIIVELKGSELISLYNKNGDYLYLDKGFNISSINYNSVYEIAVIDYVFTGVYYTEFKNKEYVDTNVLLRDILIEYIDNLY